MPALSRTGACRLREQPGRLRWRVLPACGRGRHQALAPDHLRMTKLAGELMINDYSRKDFLDGRAVRLPTIFIRPGKPNAALSSFASGLFREPLSGVDFELPVSREQGVPLLGYRKVVEAFVLAMECDGEALGDDRILTLPPAISRARHDLVPRKGCERKGDHAGQDHRSTRRPCDQGRGRLAHRD